MSTKTPFNIKGGELNKTFFSEKIKSLILQGLNITFHIVAHELRSSRSLLSIKAVSAALWSNQDPTYEA